METSATLLIFTGGSVKKKALLFVGRVKNRCIFVGEIMHNKNLGQKLLNCRSAGDKKKFFKETLKTSLLANPEKEFNTEKIFSDTYAKWRESLLNVLTEIQRLHEIEGYDVSISSDLKRFKLLRLVMD